MLRTSQCTWLYIKNIPPPPPPPPDSFFFKKLRSNFRADITSACICIRQTVPLTHCQRGKARFKYLAPPLLHVVAEIETKQGKTKWEHRWILQRGALSATSWPGTRLLWSVTTVSASDALETCGALTRTGRTIVQSGGVKPSTRLCRFIAVWYGHQLPEDKHSLAALQVLLRWLG